MRSSLTHGTRRWFGFRNSGLPGLGGDAMVLVCSWRRTPTGWSSSHSHIIPKLQAHTHGNIGNGSAGDPSSAAGAPVSKRRFQTTLLMPAHSISIHGRGLPPVDVEAGRTRLSDLLHPGQVCLLKFTLDRCYCCSVHSVRGCWVLGAGCNATPGWRCAAPARSRQTGPHSHSHCE